MNKLNEICAYKIQAMKTLYPTGQLENCRRCSGYDEYCMNFIQIIKTEIPFRTGRFFLLEENVVWK